VQLNFTIKVGALGVPSPWPGRLQYGEAASLVGIATGEPVPRLSLEVPLGDGREELRQLQLADRKAWDIFSERSPRGRSGKEAYVKGSGVAILLAGTLVRYFPNLDRHVVAPLARQGYTVDVYLSLSVEGYDSWRSWGNLFVMHPAYHGKSLDEVKGMIIDGLRDSGANAGVVRMPTQVILTSKGQAFQDHGNWWTSIDNHRDLEHGQATRGNAAKLYQELGELWTLAKEAEIRASESYKYVVILRDDSNWLFDFDLDRLLSVGGRVALDGGAGRALGQMCGHPGEPRICDYAFVAEREVAEPFGSLYRLMTDPASMGVALDPQAETVLESERYIYQVVQAFDIRFEQVPTALIPFERCGRLNVSGSTVVCRHKPTDLSYNGVPKLGVDAMIPAACEDMVKPW